jgi:hypothetical protein
MRTRKYSCILLLSSTLLLLAGCDHAKPDPRSVRGALAAAAAALESRDAIQLFRLIDQRGRNAMAASVKARNEARRLIEEDYPAAERAQAIAALGDAAQVTTPEALFARRCTESCMAELSAQVGVPVSETPQGAEVVVRTTRGATLHMHAGKDHWYGIVWNTEALSDERDQAARELLQIRENAAVYRKRTALENP